MHNFDVLGKESINVLYCISTQIFQYLTINYINLFECNVIFCYTTVLQKYCKGKSQCLMSHNH